MDFIKVEDIGDPIMNSQIHDQFKIEEPLSMTAEETGTVFSSFSEPLTDSNIDSLFHSQKDYPFPAQNAQN